MNRGLKWKIPVAWDVKVLGLSATLPNVEDIAKWQLGRPGTRFHVPCTTSKTCNEFNGLMMYYISCLELYNCVYACILYITIRVGLIRLHWTWKIVINGLLKSSPIYPYPFKSKSLHMQNKNIPPHLRLKDVLTKCCLSLKPVLLADPACQRAEFKVEGRSLPNSLPSSSLARICPLRSWTPESRWFQGIGNGGCWNHPPPLPHLGWGWLGYYRCWVTTGMLTHIACMRTRIYIHTITVICY